MRTIFKILRTEPGIHRADVRRLFEEAKEASATQAVPAKEDGTADLGVAGGGAPGTWSNVGSLAFSEQVVSSVEAAKDYLMEETAAGGPAVAIRVRELAADMAAAVEARIWQEPEAIREMEKANEASQRLTQTVGLVRAKARELVVNFLALRSGFVDCPVCESRLARAYLERAACPLCSSSILPASVQAEMARAQVRVRELDQDYRQARSTMGKTAAGVRERLLGQAQDAEVFWLVGAKVALQASTEAPGESWD